MIKFEKLHKDTYGSYFVLVPSCPDTFYILVFTNLMFFLALGQKNNLKNRRLKILYAIYLLHDATFIS